MVNVASAGGNLDYWGEYPNNDYDEYTISQDEYGYVLIETIAGDNPEFTLKRFSLGDETYCWEGKRHTSCPIKIGSIPQILALSFEIISFYIA